MNKFTKGDWEAADRGDYGDFAGASRVILADEKRIAVIHHDGSEEAEANTKIMTAAGKLVKALRLTAMGLLEVVKQLPPGELRTILADIGRSIGMVLADIDE